MAEGPRSTKASVDRGRAACLRRTVVADILMSGPSHIPGYGGEKLSGKGPGRRLARGWVVRIRTLLPVSVGVGATGGGEAWRRTSAWVGLGRDRRPDARSRGHRTH